MSTPLLEAFELIAHSQELARRLDGAAAELAKRPGLKDEKAWLETARARLGRAREGIGDLLIRALRLDELEPLRGDRARALQGEAVDALERLHAGVGFAGSPRSPLIEALFFNLKLPLLRRLEREEFARTCSDFERRLGSGYAKRMLADETYAVVAPMLQQVLHAFAIWRGVFDSTPLDETEARLLRDELASTAQRIDLPSRQARLLAQAALLSMKEVLDEHGLTPKTKRRGARDADPDTHPLLEHDPPDPHDPTPEEQAELDAERAAAEAASSPAKAASSAGKVATPPAKVATSAGKVATSPVEVGVEVEPAPEIPPRTKSKRAGAKEKPAAD